MMLEDDKTAETKTKTLILEIQTDNPSAMLARAETHIQAGYGKNRKILRADIVTKTTRTVVEEETKSMLPQPTEKKKGCC